jgi:hypothetical protein
MLTKRQREILTQMADHPHDDEGELVLEGRDAWLNWERTSPGMIWSLVRLMAISNQDGDGRLDGLTRWRINETGRQLLGRA